MQQLHSIPEAEMVAPFLRAEFASPRFAPIILAMLERDGRDRSIIDHPPVFD